MRKIKFRAWVEDENGDNHIENVSDITLTGDHFYVRTDNDAHDGYEFQNPPIMQYTGLEDKNGKEIYEGDIIQRYDGNKNIGFIKGEISCLVFRNGSFVHKHPKEEAYGPLLYTEDYCEVIGNIYENPELLNKH